jgi:phage baseplate assembly protein W
MALTPAQADAASFLGRGWAFPFSLGPTGSPELVSDEEDIRESIWIILGTNPGERVMRPDFGAGLNAFVFEPVNIRTMTLVQNRVREALIDYEARIDVLDVRVTAAGAQQERLDIELDYRVRATNALHNLVYPFYLDEGTPL